MVGDDTCSVEYDKGHEVPEAVTQALPSLAAFEQRVAAVDCFVTVGTIIDDVGLKSLFVKDLFPADDWLPHTDIRLLLTFFATRVEAKSPSNVSGR